MTARYLHGHHESVLRSHGWRTAENSAGYLAGVHRDNVEFDVADVHRPPYSDDRAYWGGSWAENPDGWITLTHGEILAHRR